MLAVLAPFVLIGTWQIREVMRLVTAGSLTSARCERGHAYLIRDARLIMGDGQVVEQGAVLVKDGKITRGLHGFRRLIPRALKAEAVDAAGKTLMPGLIDIHVHLGNPGGLYEQAAGLCTGCPTRTCRANSPHICIAA